MGCLVLTVVVLEIENQVLEVYEYNRMNKEAPQIGRDGTAELWQFNDNSIKLGNKLLCYTAVQIYKLVFHVHILADHQITRGYEVRK